ncbi:5-formyltetrahydrofolate cyclo-ligase [Roseibium aggregatum]|uniref:5-formyltetrahydrofolate cyclo-ligase n=1 Tax=Roseibium aggregatum TaxID=187304 RepID=A0A926S7B1_9HYPH|nr:5-formyltetrahydrofolate cyclo-ligase [Roseibium aggregatum]MBD1547312.1 5-formyltetrahydrofolate cyclo-ligase [Roseibium aggregatum]
MTQTDTSLAAAKDVLRRQALARRAAMEPVRRIELSLALVDALESLPIPEGAVVSGFWPIRDEIDPRPLLDRLRARGHRLCLPVVTKPHLIFRELTWETVLVPAGFGTTVPDAASPELRPDVLLMPLAAFDKAGNRIGYGKGHYDTAIAALEKNGPVTCIGLAFQTQEVDHVPAEPHDKPLDGILTENGYRPFSCPRS